MDPKCINGLGSIYTYTYVYVYIYICICINGPEKDTLRRSYCRAY